MTWKRVAKALTSGKAGLGYIAAVLISLGVIFGYWQNWGFPTPLWKHEVMSTMTTILDKFGREKIDPIGSDVRSAKDAVTALRSELVAAHGREELLKSEIRHLTEKVARMEKLTDRLYGRVSPPSEVPIPRTTPSQ